MAASATSRVILALGKSIGLAAPGIKAAALFVAAWKSPETFAKAIALWPKSPPPGIGSGSTLILLEGLQEDVERYRASFDGVKTAAAVRYFLRLVYPSAPLEEGDAGLVPADTHSIDKFVYLNTPFRPDEQRFLNDLDAAMRGYPATPFPVPPRDAPHLKWLALVRYESAIQATPAAATQASVRSSFFDEPVGLPFVGNERFIHAWEENMGAFYDFLRAPAVLRTIEKLWRSFPGYEPLPESYTRDAGTFFSHLNGPRLRQRLAVLMLAHPEIRPSKVSLQDIKAMTTFTEK